jgi:hypothetical protein
MIILTECEYVDFVPFYIISLSVIASDFHTFVFALAEFQGNYVCVCAYGNYNFYCFDLLLYKPVSRSNIFT